MSVCTFTFLIRVRQWHPVHEKVGAERHPLPRQSPYQTLLAHPGCHLHPWEQEEPGQRWTPAFPACQLRCHAGWSMCSITLQMSPPIQITCDKPSGSNTKQYSQGKACIRVASWEGISWYLTCLVSTISPGRELSFYPDYSWDDCNCSLISSWMVLSIGFVELLMSSSFIFLHVK